MIRTPEQILAAADLAAQSGETIVEVQEAAEQKAAVGEEEKRSRMYQFKYRLRITLIDTKIQLIR